MAGASLCIVFKQILDESAVIAFAQRQQKSMQVLLALLLVTIHVFVRSNFRSTVPL